MDSRSSNLPRVWAFAALVSISFMFATIISAQKSKPEREVHHRTPWLENSIGSPGFSTPKLTPRLTPTPLNPTTWTNIGPAPITADPTVEATPDSGRVNGIAVDPTNNSTIYIATSGGGVWKTTDGGTTWSPLTGSQATQAMGAIAIASDGRTLYAGTGEPNTGGDFGRGVLISTDAGATWTLKNNNGSFDRIEVSEIAVDPSNPLVAYVATVAVVGENSDSTKANGVWKTSDGGVTWSNTTSSTSGVPASSSWSALRMDPNNPLTLYAAVGNQFGAPDNGVYKTTNGGASWTKLSSAPSGAAIGRVELAVSKSDPATPPATGSVPNSNVVYISAANPNDSSLYKFVRSADGGATFVDLTSMTPNYLHSQGFFDTSLIVDPANSAIVYAGGDSNPNGIIRGVVTTTNGTTSITWTDIGGTLNGVNGPHVDHHAAAFDASGRFLDGDDGGIFQYDPVAGTWTSLNNLSTGAPSTALVNSFSIQPGTLNLALAGTQDNGTVRYTGTLDWAEVTCGDGGTVRFSATMTTRAYVACPQTPNSFFLRSDDSGLTWRAKVSGITDNTDSTQNFFSPFAVDPRDGNRVVFGAAHAWETTDAGETWAQLGTLPFPAGDTPGNIDAVSLSSTDTKVIYASAGGHIFITKDEGKTWTLQDLPNVAGQKIKSIDVFAKDHRRAVAVVSEFTNGNGNVFLTTDLGKTWTDITGTGLPALSDGGTLPIWSVAFHGDSTKTLYAGGDDGVYRTTDSGGTWTRFGAGLPTTQVFDMQLDTTLAFLAAGTFGRGIWEIQLPPATTTTVSNAKGAPGSTVSLAANVTPNGIPGSVSFTVNGVVLAGPATYDVTKGTATFSYTIPTSMAPGTYDIVADFISSDDTKGGNSGGTGTLTVQ